MGLHETARGLCLYMAPAFSNNKNVRVIIIIRGKGWLVRFSHVIRREVSTYRCFIQVKIEL